MQIFECDLCVLPFFSQLHHIRYIRNVRVFLFRIIVLLCEDYSVIFSLAHSKQANFYYPAGQKNSIRNRVWFYFESVQVAHYLLLHITYKIAYALTPYDYNCSSKFWLRAQYFFLSEIFVMRGKWRREQKKKKRKVGEIENNMPNHL